MDYLMKLSRSEMKNVLGGVKCHATDESPTMHCGSDCKVQCYVTCTDSCGNLNTPCASYYECDLD